MNKRIKTIYIVIFVLVLIILIPTSIFGLRVAAASREFTPRPTGKVNSEITAILDQNVNMYVLEKDGKYMAVDAGTSKSHIASELKRSGIDPQKVTALLLTHTDFDHTAAVSLFRNAEVYISKPEENMINGKIHRALIFNNSLKRIHHLLGDGEEIKIDGWNVKIIVIPGHTSGASCYLIDGKYLFSGDSTALTKGETTHFNSFFNMNTDEQIVSLRKLEDIQQIELVLTSHYGTAGGLIWQK